LVEAGKTHFNTKPVAWIASRFEPLAKDRPHFVVPAPAGPEIQPEARIAIPITGTMGIGINLLKENVRRLYQLISVKGWK